MACNQVFTAPAIRRIKLRKVIETIGREILHACAISCCEDTLEDIAKRCAEGKLERIHPYSGKLVKEKLFEEDRIKASQDPFGVSYDITFLSRILMLVEAEYPSVYSKVKLIKDTRNKLFHSDSPLTKEDYESKLTELENLFLETLQEAEIVSNKQLSRASCSRSSREISDGILRLQTLKSQLSPMVTKIKSESIEEGNADVLEYLKINGQEEVRKAHENLIYVNPVEFFIGTKYKVLVSDFYTELEFHDNDEESAIEHHDVIEIAETASCNVVIEGIAGVGKTTLIRTIMALKKDKTDSSLLIHFDCRNDSFSNLKDFLSYVMPKANAIFSQEKLLSAILSLRPVFMVDGLDELNENSDQIFKEIAEIVKLGGATIFATSRPEGVKKFMNRISGAEFKYLEIRGVHKEKHDKLVKKYMQIFSPHFPAHSTPSFEKISRTLIEVRSSFKEHIRVPLIICLLVYLIMNNRTLHSKQSLSEVYTAIIDALLAKLKTRIHSSTHLSDFEIDEMVEEFFSYICKLSFSSLKMNEIILKSDTSSRIAKKVREIFGNFREDAISSFFVCRGYFTPSGHQRTSYSFPHKSFQEFLAAKHFRKAFGENNQVRIWELIGPKHLSNKNLLLFIVGTMLSDSSLTREICDDIICDFVMKRKTLGDFDPNLTLRMYDILRESKAHPLMTEALSNHLTKMTLDERDDDLALFNKLFEEECPILSYVDLRFVLHSNESSPLTVDILSRLKTKNVQLNLEFLTHEGQITNCQCDSYVKVLFGGRCRIGTFSGCLGEEGIKCLPENIKKLTLYISCEREAKALQLLNNLMSETLDGELSNNRKVTVHWLDLIISGKFPSEKLPERLTNIKGVLLLKLRDVDTPEDLDWAFEAAKRIMPLQWNKMSNRTKFQVTTGAISKKVPIMSVLNIHCNFMSEKIKDFLEKLCQAKLYLTKFQIDCNQSLSGAQNEELKNLCKEKLSCKFASRLQLLARNVAARLSREAIRALPSEVKRLELIIKNEKDIEGLKCLIERMKKSESEVKTKDGTDFNSLRGIKVQCLRLLISRRCDAYLLPKKFPIPSEKLEIGFGGVEKDDIAWILEVMDRLPRTSDSKCDKIDVWLLNFYLKEESIKFMEQLEGKAFQNMTIHINNPSSSERFHHILQLRQNEGICFNFFH